MEIAIKGHSGCEVEIVQEEKGLFIYKKTRDLAYINRLQRQGEKQLRYSKENGLMMKIPNIINIQSTPKICSIQMEYVYALNFVDFFERSGMKHIESSYAALEQLILWEIENSVMMTVPSHILYSKFEDVRNKVLKNQFTSNNLKIRQLLELSAILYEQLDEMYLPIGKCHGDLTFSNILFDGGSNYLIDFLDSFIETPLIDLVKLRQDTCFYWSEQMFTGHYDSLRLHFILNKMDQRINQMANQFDWYQKWYPLFQLINFWRIMQYATAPPVISYLENVLSKMITDLTNSKL